MNEGIEGVSNIIEEHWELALGVLIVGGVIGALGRHYGARIYDALTFADYEKEKENATQRIVDMVSSRRD
ncbi:MAG: hypothetical protein ACJKTH_02605 [Patescibacteria group bacterium UBA2163]